MAVERIACGGDALLFPRALEGRGVVRVEVVQRDDLHVLALQAEQEAMGFRDAKRKGSTNSLVGDSPTDAKASAKESAKERLRLRPPGPSSPLKDKIRAPTARMGAGGERVQSRGRLIEGGRSGGLGRIALAPAARSFSTDSIEDVSYNIIEGCPVPRRKIVMVQI